MKFRVLMLFYITTFILVPAVLTNSWDNGSLERAPALLHDAPSNQTVDDTTKSNVMVRLLQSPLHFISNQGQMDETVFYYAKSDGATVYCTDQGLAFGFADGSISLNFYGGRRVQPKAQVGLPGRVNYFIGGDPLSWQANVPTFGEIVYPAVYPGIDLVYSGDQRRLKYTFYIEPGANPDRIRMMYEGVEDIQVDGVTGGLIIQTEWGEISDIAPVAYQDIDGARRNVDTQFLVQDGRSVGFVVGDYDASHTLVLDPMYSTYLGGTSTDVGRSIAVDGSGNAYITGRTESASGFPILNALQATHSGSSDVFVTKLSASGSLVYSTYLGGANSDHGRGIAVDDSGNAYVTGYTSSTSGFPIQSMSQGTYGDGDYDPFMTNLPASDLPVYSTHLGEDDSDHSSGIAVNGSGDAFVTGHIDSTSGFPIQSAFQATHGGGIDAFATKLSDSGSLVYSTYLGGANSDYGLGIAVDDSGNAYITGYTDSTSDFPIQNAFQTTYGGGNWDAFVTKLSSSGSLVYSTYLGGDDLDAGYGIGSDGSGNVYIAGGTSSTSGFPILNAFQATYGGGTWDAFATSLSSSGSLVYSTYLGGEEGDWGNGMAADGSGNVYIAGYTDSASDFPIQNAIQTTYGGGTWDAFATKLSSSGSVIYSTYLGGEDGDLGFGAAVDGSGNVYIAGYTNSASDFPIQNAIQTTYGGGVWDVFVTKLSSIGSLVYSTYLGGQMGDVGLSVAVNVSGNAYVTGVTDSSSDFPIQNALQANFGGGGTDAFVAQLPAEITFSVMLREDWNLISIPVELANTSREVVLQDIDGLYTEIWGYSANPGWERYVVGGEPFLNDLTDVVPGKGYWVKMSQAASLAFDSALVEDTIALLESWNLVGFNHLTAMDFADAMASIDGFWNSVWGFDPIDGWERYVVAGPPILNDLVEFRPGKGYWIDADAGCPPWDVNDVGGVAAPPSSVAATGFISSRVPTVRPDIPYTIWGNVEANGMRIADGATVVLKVDDMLQSSYKLGARANYGDRYVLNIPSTVHGYEQVSLYVQANDTEIKAATVPPGVSGQVIHLDLSVKLSPKVSVLHQNYPNPFNPETWIPYQLKEEAQVEIRIYTSTGQLVRTLNLGHKTAGFYTYKAKAAYWDGRNSIGEPVASGVYFYSIQAGDLTTMRKMIVTR